MREVRTHYSHASALKYSETQYVRKVLNSQLSPSRLRTPSQSNIYLIGMIYSISHFKIPQRDISKKKY